MRLNACLGVLFTMCVLLGVASAEEKKEVHPYKAAKVGDWIEYNVTDVKSGKTFESHFKLLVKEKYENEIVFARDENYGKRKMPTGEEHIELNKPYRQDGDGESWTYEVKAEKDEKITVGGKEYACKMKEMIIYSSAPGADPLTRKVWTCKDVALDGIVKSVTVNGKDTKTRELVGSGHGAGK